MKPPHQHPRVDLAELKDGIVKKLGQERSKQYFYFLSKFMNLKLSKVEFNKLCFRIVGRENIPLHNQFVHSILRNACSAKVPPPYKSLSKQTEPNRLVLSNGDIHDHKILKHSDSGIKLENGDLSQKQVQHHQVLANEGEEPHLQNHEKVLEKSAFCAASSCSISGLLDNTALRERMEKIASIQGVKGVSMECSSLLNKGLDCYLKGLISSGVELVKSRSSSEQTRSYTNKHQANSKQINGVIHGQNHQHKLGDLPFCPLSLLDFKVAMELNPQKLGEDWPLLMEKICTQAFNEE